MRRPLIALLVLIALCLFTLPVSAQSTSALINEQLDKQFELNVAEKTPLPQILRLITEKSDVKFDVSPHVYELLPWGEQTTLQVKIANQTLRGALQAITRKLGLVFSLGSDAVRIEPLPALRRLGRRASVEELDVLDMLARTPLQPHVDGPTVKQLLANVDAVLEANKSAFAVESRIPDSIAGVTISVPRGATLLDALETIPQNTDATWYPWGRTLVVQPKIDQLRSQLQKTITRRFSNVDIGQVLKELASAAGVDFAIEPGAFQRVPADARNVNLMLDNVSIQQALENLAGFTGLAWSVNEKGVYVWNPDGGTGAAREPTVGLLTLDNGMQIIIRESQLPPDLREYVRHKTEQQFERMREMMKEEGFVPPPAPGTQPAATQPEEPAAAPSPAPAEPPQDL